MNRAPLPRVIPGCDRILHGGDYNPDQWLHEPAIIDEDFRLMPIAGCNTFSVGIFAWAALEPEEGRFTFEWLDSIMDRMHAGGHRVFLATPSGAKPGWMAARYPEIRRVLKDGRREHQHARHNHCWSSPVYREKVSIINRLLAQRYGKHPALAAWHISNEYLGECYCDLCLNRWREWLKERYSSLEELNRAWWTSFWAHTFSDWALIDPRDAQIDGMGLDWRRFCNWQIGDFFDWECRPMRELTPRTPCTTNFMGLYPFNDYAEVAPHVDFVTDDQYPMFTASDPHLHRNAARIALKDDLFRNLKPDRPWILMESCPGSPQWQSHMPVKSPGLHRCEMFQALGHGAEGTMYFQWRAGRGGSEKFHGAVVDHTGNESTRVFKSVADLGQAYGSMQEILGSRVEAEVALLYDWESKWAAALSQGPQISHESYDAVCIDLYEPFHARGIAVDVLHPSADFSAHRVLVIPQLWIMTPGLAARIRSFVEGGGIAVMTWFSAMCDPHNRCLLGGWPGEGLRELFGVWFEEWDGLTPGSTRAVSAVPKNTLGLAGSWTADTLCGILHAEGAEALLNYDEQFYAGSPVVTWRPVGKGAACFIGAKLSLPALDQIFDGIINRADVRACVAERPTRGLAVQCRVAADARRFLFAENFSAQPATLNFLPGEWTCLERKTSFSGQLTLAPFEARVFVGPAQG